MNNWLLSLILGILTIIVGIIGLRYPLGTALGVELFISFSFIILGIIVVISAFTGNESNGRIWTIILGILMVIAGIILVGSPVIGAALIGWTFAIYAIITGVYMFFAGFKIRDNSMKWLTILSGAASVILGILVFQMPVASIAILFSTQMIIFGVALIALALARRRGGVEAS